MATYKKTVRNPVRLGTLGIVKAEVFELTAEQEKEPKIAKQIEIGLIAKATKEEAKQKTSLFGTKKEG